LTSKTALVTAISSLTSQGRREAARRFLEGLSTDELQYIASFYGARLLEALPVNCLRTRDEVACEIQRYVAERKGAEKLCPCQAGPPPDASHKMLLLFEYLCVSSRAHGPRAMSMRAGSA